jgi:isoleucyl-tRNA synthetase
MSAQHRPIPEVIDASELIPDEYGNTYITFGDGTGAVHTAQGWIMVKEERRA